MIAGTTTPKSNRLKTLSNPAVSLTHQATGQTLSDASGASYSYYRNGSIRLIMLPGRTQSVMFMYDANGQRLRKYTDNQVGSVWVVDEASQTHFVYDQAGHLLGEYDKSGASLREYIWLDDVPVAMFTPGATASAAPIVYYIHTDHLNTPRAVMDTAGNLRWRWIADPFGTAVPETNPAGLGALTQNLRMPGQVAGGETGLFYNMARYYDPMLGRYTQSDPIGLAGGINTYAYVGGNPISYVDPTGLDPWWSDPTLKRIPNDNARVTAWLCRAYEEGGEQGAWGYIISQRKVGNDKYDDNLAAADRFGDMMNGNYSGYPPFQSSDFNLGQVVNKVRRNVVNGGRGNGSQSPEFVGRWGAIGAFYSEQGMRWADWAAKNCPCR